MTEAEETKLLIHKKTLQKMLNETENEVHYYKYRYKKAFLETSKFRYKEAMNQYKAEYEALDYAIELIKKELGEAESSCDTCAMYFPDDGCMAGLADGEVAE